MASVVCTLHHNIGGESAFERGLSLSCTLESFDAQVKWLAREYDIINLDCLLSDKLPRRPLLLTFDDAFRSVLEVGRQILAPRGLPSVYFINPGLLGASSLSFDSLLAWANNHFGIDALCEAIGVPTRPTLANLIWTDMAKLGPAARTDVRQRLIAAVGHPDVTERAELLEPGDLAEMAALGMEVGNHTMTHVHCRALTPAEMQAEVVDARIELERLGGRRVRAFSVPYGNEADLTPALLQTLRASGHEAIFLVHARSNWRRPARDVWYRTSLTSQPPGALYRKLVLLPALRTVRDAIRV
jgi:peptidoglycan/xylan/chitin deacetylase (PgdA/CDA1 family)